MENTIMRIPRVCEIVGLSRSTIYRLERAGEFPRRRRLGVNSVGWMSSDIQQWIVSRDQAGQPNGGQHAH